MSELSKMIANISKAPTRIHEEGYTAKAIKMAEDLERQLAEAKQNIYKFAEIALMEGKDEFGHSWEDFKLYVLDEQLKEKGE